jgi:hypothetical protein
MFINDVAGLLEAQINVHRDCWDLSDWKIPKVRFVEVATENTMKQWTKRRSPSHTYEIPGRAR